jgi:hypothetical protein
MSVAEPVADIRREPAVVRFDRLLSIYLVVPVAFALVLCDLFVFGGRLRRALPHHPDQIAFFTIFFNLPHIVASHLIFADRQYLVHYRRQLLGFSLGLAVVTPILYVLAQPVLVVAALLYTYFHVLSQQIGLTGAQLRTADRSFVAWKWTMILVGVGGYVCSIEPNVPGQKVRAWFALGALVLIVPSFFLAARLHRLAKSEGPRRYLWANQAMICGMLVFALIGYPFFAVLMARVVHDLTAFYVYGVHDHNRHAAGIRGNLLYRVSGALGIPTFVLGPVVAIGIAFVVMRLLPTMASLWTVYVLSAFHYYLEGVVWKRGTPHRAHASFA